jgi:GNAT superfamily N-acetyltransferase
MTTNEPRPVRAEGAVSIRPASGADQSWMESVLTEHWGSARVVTRGRLHDALACPAFVAQEGGEPVGLATFRIAGDECEILTMNSLRSGRGTGRRLVEAVLRTAKRNRCRRIWLVTTNDNRNAQGFWEHVGFSLAAVHKDSLIEARKLKPEIPRFGEGGVPMTDELEYERFLSSGTTE